MNDIEKRARELLAAEYDSNGGWFAAECIRNSDPRWDASEALSAIIAALTPSEGFVLVPISPTEEMIEGFWGKIQHGEHERAAAEDAWRDALAARPEVSP